MTKLKQCSHFYVHKLDIGAMYATIYLEGLQKNRSNLHWGDSSPFME